MASPPPLLLLLRLVVGSAGAVDELVVDETAAAPPCRFEGLRSAPRPGFGCVVAGMPFFFLNSDHPKSSADSASASLSAGVAASDAFDDGAAELAPLVILWLLSRSLRCKSPASSG